MNIVCSVLFTAKIKVNISFPSGILDLASCFREVPLNRESWTQDPAVREGMSFPFQRILDVVAVL